MSEQKQKRRPGRTREQPIGQRTAIYFNEGDVKLASSLLDGFDNNLSALMSFCLHAGHEKLGFRRDMIRNAVLALYEALQPDEQYDPADDPRAEGPHMLLAALLGEQEAQAISEALSQIAMQALYQRYDIPPSTSSEEDDDWSKPQTAP